MAATAKTITVATSASNGNLKDLFNQVKKCFYVNSAITAKTLTDTGFEAFCELPILEDGVTFDTGSADKTEINLTDGTIWTSKVDKGDSDISLQVASVSDKIASLFMTKVGAEISSINSPLSGSYYTYAGYAYSLDVKAVNGALVMFDQSGETMIVLTNVTMYASFNGADGDNPAYFDVAVTPSVNADGAAIYVLRKTGTYTPTA